MKRSKWKAHSLYRESNNSRSKIIQPNMINTIVKVSNGNRDKDIKLTVDHVKHRLGEFNFTKVTPRFKKKK